MILRFDVYTLSALRVCITRERDAVAIVDCCAAARRSRCWRMICERGARRMLMMPSCCLLRERGGVIITRESAFERRQRAI